MPFNRYVRFDEQSVEEWCHNSNNVNDIHLGDGDSSPFGERVVPGMMVMDHVSGLLSMYGEHVDKTVIPANIVAARFRDPIPLGARVEISIEEEDSDNNFTYFEFIARDSDTLYVHGTISVVVK